MLKTCYRKSSSLMWVYPVFVRQERLIFLGIWFIGSFKQLQDTGNLMIEITMATRDWTLLVPFQLSFSEGKQTIKYVYTRVCICLQMSLVCCLRQFSNITFLFVYVYTYISCLMFISINVVICFIQLFIVYKYYYCLLLYIVVYCLLFTSITIVCCYIQLFIVYCLQVLLLFVVLYSCLLFTVYIDCFGTLLKK